VRRRLSKSEGFGGSELWNRLISGRECIQKKSKLGAASRPSWFGSLEKRKTDHGRTSTIGPLVKGRARRVPFCPSGREYSLTKSLR